MLVEQLKTCKGCNKTKPLSLFHKHKQMADGRLNFCKTCFYEKAKVYRANNPDSRKTEYVRRRVRQGHMTMVEYIAKRNENAKGRKVSINEYAQKRRAKVNQDKLTELDIFVLVEAYKLRDIRQKLFLFSWHVDHIVPLNYKNACGLHNAYNLQVVPAKWNMVKQNRNMNRYLGV
jgi:hypothetical protein